MDAFYEWLKAHAQDILAWASDKIPVLATIALFMGTLRAFFKPVIAAIGQAVKETPTDRDDKIFDQVTTSKWFKVFAWLLDFFASVKNPTK